MPKIELHISSTNYYLINLELYQLEHFYYDLVLAKNMVVQLNLLLEQVAAVAYLGMSLDTIHHRASCCCCCRSWQTAINRIKGGWCKPWIFQYDLNIPIFFIQDSPQERDHDPGNGPPHLVLAVVPILADAGDELGGIVIQHVEMPVVLGHKVVAWRLALVVELPVVDVFRGTGREEYVLLLFTQPGADDQHRHRKVERGGLVGEDLWWELGGLACAGNRVKTDERGEVQVGLAMPQG